MDIDINNFDKIKFTYPMKYPYLCRQQLHTRPTSVLYFAPKIGDKIQVLIKITENS